MKKYWIGAIILLAAVAITLGTIGAEIGNQNVTTAGIMVGAVTIVILVVFLFYVARNMKSAARDFESYYQAGDYEGGIEFYEKEVKSRPAGPARSQCAYYLMTFYFLINDLEKARDLFGEIEFGNYEDYVLYYDILLDLYDGIVGDAREKYKRFMESTHKELNVRKDILTQIFDFIDDKIDTIEIQSDYPIIKDVIDRYAGEEQEQEYTNAI